MTNGQNDAGKMVDGASAEPLVADADRQTGSSVVKNRRQPVAQRIADRIGCRWSADRKAPSLHSEPAVHRAALGHPRVWLGFFSIGYLRFIGLASLSTLRTGMPDRDGETERI